MSLPGAGRAHHGCLLSLVLRLNSLVYNSLPSDDVGVHARISVGHFLERDALRTLAPDEHDLVSQRDLGQFG